MPVQRAVDGFPCVVLFVDVDQGRQSAVFKCGFKPVVGVWIEHGIFLSESDSELIIFELYHRQKYNSIKSINLQGGSNMSTLEFDGEKYKIASKHQKEWGRDLIKFITGCHSRSSFSSKEALNHLFLLTVL